MKAPYRAERALEYTLDKKEVLVSVLFLLFFGMAKKLKNL